MIKYMHFKCLSSFNVGGSLRGAEVVIRVGDINDNPPYFPYSPIVLGVPKQADYNHLVARIQVGPTLYLSAFLITVYHLLKWSPNI